METRNDLLATVADLRAAADILETANDSAMLEDVRALIQSATDRMPELLSKRR